MRIDAWLTLARDRLSQADVESARLESELLLAHALGVDRAWILAHPEAEVPDRADALLERRVGGEPLAYLFGEREFYGRPFRVDPRVLIPRQETEILVEAVLQHAPANARVLDLGTGSGCIAVTLKLERPDLTVTAVDLSPGALEVASENARRLGAHVRFLRSDGFEELLGESFELIATNPPYIGLDEPLASEVRDHEPHAALFAGPRGDEFYERLAREARDALVTGGLLAMEVGYRQSRVVRERFEAEGWRHVETRRDLSGIERVLVVSPVFECSRA